MTYGSGPDIHLERKDRPISSPPDGTTVLGAWGQLAWFAAVAVAWSILLMGLPLDPDYTAGELLDHLASWLRTGVLYPELGATPPYRVLNYPPLVLVAGRVLAGLGLSELAAGRAVNAVGLVALVVVAAWWARARGAGSTTVAGTVGLLGASFPVLYGAGQFHIELWASALTLGGFALLHRAGGRREAALAGAALALACFAKQTQVVPALVALAWAWRYRRTAAPVATAALTALGLVGWAAITLVWGFEPWRHMIEYTVGTYSLANLGLQAASHALPWAVLLAFAARTAWLERTTAAADPVFWLWVGSLVWSLSAARIGSGYAYYLDLHLATAIWVGPRIFGVGRSGPRRLWGWLLAVQIVGADVGVGATLAVNAARLRAVDDELPSLCAALSDAPDVIAEDVGIARACGRRPVLHPFIMTSLAERGRWDPSPLEAAVRRGDVPVVLLLFDPREPARGAHGERWPPGLLEAFARAPSVERLPPGYWVLRW